MVERTWQPNENDSENTHEGTEYSDRDPWESRERRKFDSFGCWSHFDRDFFLYNENSNIIFVGRHV
jgi:hypothetical protein